LINYNNNSISKSININKDFWVIKEFFIKKFQFNKLCFIYCSFKWGKKNVFPSIKNFSKNWSRVWVFRNKNFNVLCNKTRVSKISNDYGKSRTEHIILLYCIICCYTGITKVKNQHIDQQLHHDSIDSQWNNHSTVLQCWIFCQT